MIQAKELRIGNLVHIVDPFDGLIEAEILAGAIYDISEMERLGKPMHYAPIELTEKWLFRFGFEKVCENLKHNFYHFENENCWVYLLGADNPFFEFEINTSGGGRFNLHRSYKYVHQLQNLFYALTGQELEMKQ